MPSTSTLVDSIYTRRVSAGECYPPDLVKSLKKTQQSINLLKEKRAALITAAVTGKIDVRNWNTEAA